MGCVGDTVISNIQLEKGSIPTDFVMPKINQTPLSGIFSALQGLRVEMRDKQSDLWSEIIANNKAMLVSYHDKELSASLGVSAEQIRQEVKNALDGKSSIYEQNVNGFRRRVQDEITASTVTQLSNLYDRKFETVNGNYSQTQQTVNALTQRIQSAEGAVTQSTQTINGFRNDVQSVNGNYSRLTQNLDGLQSTVRDNQNNTESKYTQLSRLIESKVTRSDVTGIIRNSGDDIALAIRGKGIGDMTGTEIINKINVTTGGVGIYSGTNKLVITPNTTYIQNGTIKNAMIQSLSADKMTTGTLDAANVNIINLTASRINGLDANFIRAKIETALVDWLKGKVISAQNDAMRINLNQANITFNQNATIDFNSPNNALVRRKGTHTAFVHFEDVNYSDDNGAGSLHTSIGVTSSGDGVNSKSSGRFAGARFYRGAIGYSHVETIDKAEIFGDAIYLRDDFSRERGFKFSPVHTTKMIDMNYLVGAVQALIRCWGHWNNVGWDPSHSNLRNAINNEYNNHMKGL